MILETVTRACPGLRDALFLVSKARFLAGDIKSALSTLQHVVDNLDSTMAEAHLLMAQIQVYQGNYLSAQQSLEVGLSFNFEVKDHPLFHLINAKVQKDQGKISEAEKTLKKALELTNLEAAKRLKKQGGNTDNSKKIAFTSTDLATIYLELADCHRIQGKAQESNRVMQEAMAKFQVFIKNYRVDID